MKVIWIIGLVIYGLYRLYKSYQENAQKQAPSRKPPGYGQYTPKPDPRPVETQAQSQPIGSPVAKPTSIEEALEQMVRQAKERKEAEERKMAPYTPTVEYDVLGQRIESIERTSAPLDTPAASSEPGKGYKFSDSMAGSTLTREIRKEQKKGILKEAEKLAEAKPERAAFSGPMSPREAFKYMILLERKHF